ncbi:MAG TPA: tRNA uridine-5-carboxymethylaminomethyl(34) synthesis GTPase MnmE [Candidatus Enterosoma merdigallinarum]|nr:tRNA uridine-5-carboxymethylaminomethyl(34) synthesis GTPase MnmE [Candidatus Enterosoma merdigallinarum]
MLVFDTICALATPPYRSALAIVRLSGPKAFDVLQKIVHRDVSKLEMDRAYLTKLYRGGKLKEGYIDECLMVLYKAPKSYTGFDSVDFSIHGSPIVAEVLLAALSEAGARRAERGEFSAQAYFNGKMDLLKAQGINDLIHATSRRAVEVANHTLSGENTKLVQRLKENLLEDIASLEYYVEDQYSDEKDDYDEELEKVASSLEKEVAQWRDILDRTRRSNREYQGIRVAIVGEPNVGKSTLLNALIKEDKAIVSSIPGTTRDIVEGEREIDGLRFMFKDTAGIRKTDDEIESIGINKSFETIRQADIILLVSDSGFAFLSGEKDLLQAIGEKPMIKVGTKRDLGGVSQGADIFLSSLQDDLTPLIALILKKLDLDKKEESAFLGKREEDYIASIVTKLDEAFSTIKETHQIDIASDTIRQALDLINALMGEGATQSMEDIYQTLFSRFCLGK